MSVEENKRLMKTLDDAWNNQDWDTLTKAREAGCRLLARSARAHARTARPSGRGRTVLQDVP
ncbi:MAG: hypothetical protein ACXV5T_07755 [Halobacteriota archaeon]